MYMQLQAKFQCKLDSMEKQLTEQKSELNKLRTQRQTRFERPSSIKFASSPIDFPNEFKTESTPAPNKVKQNCPDRGNIGLLPTLDSTESARPIQRPVAYNGESLWESYHAQFEITSQLNGWTDLQKAAYLATSLKGPALNVLGNLPPERHYDYNVLVSALENRFGPAHRTELSRVRFKHRAKQKDESLAALAEDLERLERLAYPEAPPDLQNVLSRDQFVDALPGEDMRLRLKQEKPKSLRQALELALELESFQLASRQRQFRTVRGAKTNFDKRENDGRRPDNPAGSVESVWTHEMLQRLENVMRECMDGKPKGR
jgi:hypothetical protein